MGGKQRRSCALVALALLAGLAGCEGSCRRTAKETAEIAVSSTTRELRTRPAEAPARSRQGSPILIIALDGIGRDLLYERLRAGKLPHLAKLLGGDPAGGFPHAHFEERLLSTLPSTTIAAWTTAFTGEPPAVHGVTGNEFFIRETETFAAPAPVSFESAGLVMANYTDGYLNRLVPVPTVYDLLRVREPNILIWVAMHHLQKGADTLVLTTRAAMVEAFQAFLTEQVEDATDQAARDPHGAPDIPAAYATLDEEIVEETIETLDDRDIPPDLLTVYLPGADLFAHVSPADPDVARGLYLEKVIDRLMGELAAALAAKGALDDRYVVVTSDHGHTDVLRDDAHSLGTRGGDEPPDVLTKSGFRVRPFETDIGDGVTFDSVFAYQGAMAYVYLADRSTCAQPGQRCDWRKPPRFRDDVVPAAEAFWRNDQRGNLVPALRGTLDMILTRRPVPVEEKDEPFEVYVGDGRTIPIEAYLREHPHPTYVALAERLRDLGEGPRGERAGDLVLLAHNGDRERPEDRHYFAGLYQSWHGSPSRRDSEIPLITAHPGRTNQELASITDEVLVTSHFQQAITRLVLRLRREPP